MPTKTIQRGAAARPRTTAAVATSELTASEKIDRHIASIGDWRGGTLATIRRIMLAADPAVTEDWKWMGSPVWYCEGIVAVANPHRGKVKVTFAKGAHVPDPERLFNNGLDGKEWRAIDLFEADGLDEAAFRRLVKAAIAYNRSQGKQKQMQRAERRTKAS